MSILWNSSGHSLLGRCKFIAIFVGKMEGVFDPLMRQDLGVCPCVVHILAAVFLGRAHTDERCSTFAKVHLGQRASKAGRPPPLPHILRVAPSLPYLLNRCIKDACNDNIVLWCAVGRLI